MTFKMGMSNTLSLSTDEGELEQVTRADNLAFCLLMLDERHCSQPSIREQDIHVVSLQRGPMSTHRSQRAHFQARLK